MGKNNTLTKDCRIIENEVIKTLLVLYHCHLDNVSGLCDSVLGENETFPKED
jgi:hypothetical protein